MEDTVFLFKVANYKDLWRTGRVKFNILMIFINDYLTLTKVLPLLKI